MPNRKRRVFLVVFVVLLIVCISLVVLFREADSVDTFSPDGPYPVIVKIMHIEHLGRKMPVMVWYPKLREGSSHYLYNTKIRGSAQFDAPSKNKGAPYPLIVFSHGLGECGCMSVYYTENLASFGYVVIAPDHKDSMMCHIEGEPDVTFGDMAVAAGKSFGDLHKTVGILFGDFLKEIGYDFSYRPVEAKAVIDQALAWNSDPASFLYGMIDPDRIGMTGHSLGGFTSFMIGGMPFHCDEDSGPGKCDSANTTLDTVDFCCLDSVRKLENPFQLSDRRVVAILPMGPATFFPQLEKAASEIKIPIMIITGDDEKMEVEWEPIWTIYTHAPPPKYVIKLKKTDHMTIADFIVTRRITRLLYPGFRFSFKKKAQAYKDYSVAFFDLYLKGDNARAEILESASNRFVELWHKAE